MSLGAIDALYGSLFIMPQSTIRFYEELNDFLPEERRKKDFSVSFQLPSTVRDVIQSLCVPLDDVDLILVNGGSVDFSYTLQGGERISVYPVFESLDIRSATHLRPVPLRDLRFVVDVELGELAKKLRLLGFDCVHDNDADSQSLVNMSIQQGLVLLTRNSALLNHPDISRAVLVKDTDPKKQLKEILERLDLSDEERIS